MKGRYIIWVFLLGAAITAWFVYTPESDMVPTPQKTNPPSTPAVTLRPNAVTRALSAAPGAIVCPTLQNVQLLFGLYAEHWEGETKSRLTNGQSESIEGPVPPEPNPADYGCWLLPPGTPVEARSGEGVLKGVPVIRARLSDGSVIQGMTLMDMLAAPPWN